MKNILKKPSNKFKFINDSISYIKTPKFIIGLLVSILIATISMIIPKYIITPERIYIQESYMPKKEITVFREDSTNLFQSNLNNDDLQIRYKGNIVEGLYLLKYSFRNTGNIPVLAEDYILPITINGGWNRIIEYNCIDSNNDHLKTQIIKETSIDNGNITLPKILMNSNVYFTITFLIEKIPTKINIDSRIVGINELPIINNTTYEKNRLQQQKYIEEIGNQLQKDIETYKRANLITEFYRQGIRLLPKQHRVS